MVLFDYLPIVVLGFALEVVDASFGMGYGTILSPVLLLIGFDPHQSVPAILVSQLAGDFSAAYFHHKFKNVDIPFGSTTFNVIVVLSLLGSIGSVVAVAVAVSLPKLLLGLFMGTSFAFTGMILLATRSKSYGFSWIRLFGFGSLAALLKSISGGGYGPIVTSGQIIADVEARSAVGIVSYAEGVTCCVAVLMYVLLGRNIDWILSILLSVGVVLSAPIAALIVRKIESRRLRLIVGILTLLLGLLTILRAF